MKRAADPRALFAAARAEAPSRASRAAMWQNVEAGLALVPPATASGTRLVDAVRPSVPPPASAPSAVVSTSAVLKAGLIGGGIGSGVTAIAVLSALHAPAPRLGPDDVGLESVRVTTTDEPRRAPSVLAPIVAAAAEPSPSRTARALEEDHGSEETLAREVSLVMSARSALVSGDPLRALDLASRARALHGQLGHEATTLELRALRALGRDQEADRVEIELRVRATRDDAR